MISAIPAYLENANARILSLAILIVMFAVFWISPVKQVTDSAYSMLLTQSLIEHRTFSLEQYSIPRLEPKPRGYYTQDGNIYQLELVGDHIFYHLPPGSSVLSIPYFAAGRVFGLSVTNPDGTYSDAKEVRIEAGLAALLMAIFVVIQYWTARLMLPASWSMIVAVGAALGTQVWSTASRAMWSDTWGILLLGAAIYLVLAHEMARRKMNSIVFATLLAWMYFVRPTNSVHIAAITIYVFLFHRELIVRYLLTGAAWLGAFVAYSWHYYHQLLPNYYQASRLYFGNFWTALAGHLISPGRGLLVYVPVVIFIAYLLVRYWRYIPRRRLVWLSVAVIIAHLFVISSFGHWWGGSSFGPRFTTGLVPWFGLLAILGVHAMRIANQGKSFSNAWRRIEITTGIILMLASVIINGRGAISRATWLWNIQPRFVDQHPERLWDWHEPQFLAGLVNPSLPVELPVIGSQTVYFARPEAQDFLWYGWSTPETEFRWTDGNQATVIFALDHISDLELTMKFGAFLVPAKHPQQRVRMKINGHPMQPVTITEADGQEYTLHIARELLSERNVLTFDLPDAIEPNRLRKDRDVRRLGIAMYWMNFQSK